MAVDRPILLLESSSNRDDRVQAFGLAGLSSLVLHVLLAVVLMIDKETPGTPHPPRKVRVAISLKEFLPPRPPTTPVAAPSPPPAPAPAPPAPAETPVPRPHPIPPKKVEQRQAADPANAVPQKPQSAAAPQEPQPDDILGKLQDNWLRPPGSAEHFRCRLRIDYAAGGIVTAVRLADKCGTAALDESIIRAAWKSQPLPIPAKSASGGSVDIVFTP